MGRFCGSLLGVLVLAGGVGCARSTESSAPTQSFEERLAANPTWQPGDSKATPREIVRMNPEPHAEATVTPMQLMTEIRNRCGEAATFAVGPESAVPGERSPTNTLAQGEAIVSSLTSEEWVYLRTVGGWERANGSGGWIVFSGKHACDGVSAVHRSGGS